MSENEQVLEALLEDHDSLLSSVEILDPGDEDEEEEWKRLLADSYH